MSNVQKNRAAGLIIRNNSLLCFFRKKNEFEYFCLPGGGVEKNETEQRAIVRELAEELSLNVKSVQFLFSINNQGRNEFYFLITQYSGTPQKNCETAQKNPNNIYEIQWIDFGKLKKLSNFYPFKAKEKILKLSKTLQNNPNA